MERKLLGQFLQSTRQLKQDEQAVHDAQLNEQGLKRLLEEIPEGPEAPRIPDRKFETRVTLLDERSRSGDLVRQATVQVHAHDPSTYYLIQMARVAKSVRNAVISLEQVGDQLEFVCESGAANPTRWQENEHRLMELEGIRVGGISARRHLLD